MAEILCSLRKKSGGGTMTETTLWTNPSPTADFATQSVNLSDNISNYDYIEIEACFSKSETTKIMSYLYKASEVSGSVFNTVHPIIYIGNYYSNKYYYRPFNYSSDTSFSIGTCKTNTGSGSASNYNAGCIPLTIKGLKYA